MGTPDEDKDERIKIGGTPADRADPLATLTVQEIASSYRVSESVVRYWIRNKFIPYRLVGPRGAIHIRRSDLIAMFESGEHSGTQINPIVQTEAATDPILPNSDQHATHHPQGYGSGGIGQGQADTVPHRGEGEGLQSDSLGPGRAAADAKGKRRSR